MPYKIIMNLSDEISISVTYGSKDEFHKMVSDYHQILYIIIHIMLYSCFSGNK